MAIEGPLKELGLHDVFQLLDLSRKTGELRITSHLRNNEGKVAFEAGAIVWAEIRSNPHRIGDLLIRAGKITEADLERARAIQEREPGRRLLGQVLVGMGVISEREVQRQVETHIGEAVFELLSWQEGFFAFTEGPPVGIPGGATVRVRTESLLMEGARRIDEWSRIESHIPHLGVVPALAPLDLAGAASQLDLLPEEWEVLAQVDGERDVRAIAAALDRSAFEVARTLFGLVTTGVVVLNDPATARQSRASVGDEAGALLATAELRLETGDLSGAKAAALAAASARPGEPRAHVVLARAYLAEGRWGDAVEQCRRAVRVAPEAADGYRWLGLALAGAGRFGEAREQFERWEQLAQNGTTPAGREEVAAAKAAAETLDRLLGAVRG